MERTLSVGDCVVYVDEHGLPHGALITAIHGSIWKAQWRGGAWNTEIVDGAGPVDTRYPCINLLHVSSDETKQDPYGRQIERVTSVVYRTDSSAHGFYWMYEGEEPNPVADIIQR